MVIVLLLTSQKVLAQTAGSWCVCRLSDDDARQLNFTYIRRRLSSRTNEHEKLQPHPGSHHNPRKDVDDVRSYVDLMLNGFPKGYIYMSYSQHLMRIFFRSG